LDDADRVPVLIGVGEICDRPATDADGMDSIDLMLAALEAAERDAGVAVLGRLDWLGVEDEISFPMPAPQDELAKRLPTPPARRVKTLEASGDGPLQLLNDAANLIGRGEIRLAATAGGEALRTAAKRAQAAIAAGRESPKSSVAEVAAANAKPLARKFGLLGTDIRGGPGRERRHLVRLLRGRDGEPECLAAQARPGRADRRGHGRQPHGELSLHQTDGRQRVGEHGCCGDRGESRHGA
jgi:hypothetical protein